MIPAARVAAGLEAHPTFKVTHAAHIFPDSTNQGISRGYEDGYKVRVGHSFILKRPKSPP
jgi:hypothetical protein